MGIRTRPTSNDTRTPSTTPTHAHTHTHAQAQAATMALLLNNDVFAPLALFDDSFFGGAFVDATPRTNRCGKVCRPAASRWPKLDLVEKEDGLTLSSETDETKEAKADDGEVIRRERRVLSFTRSVQLPADIDEAKIEASSSDGVLTLSLPKAPQSVPKQIDIN